MIPKKIKFRKKTRWEFVFYSILSRKKKLMFFFVQDCKNSRTDDTEKKGRHFSRNISTQSAQISTTPQKDASFFTTVEQNLRSCQNVEQSTSNTVWPVIAALLHHWNYRSQHDKLCQPVTTQHLFKATNETKVPINRQRWGCIHTGKGCFDLRPRRPPHQPPRVATSVFLAPSAGIAGWQITLR